MQTRRKLINYLLASLLSTFCALAQTSLTQVQDTVTTPSGTPFNGTVVISWTGGSVTSGTTPFNTDVTISNGVLSVALVPTTTITPVAYYQAVYNSSDGLTTWTETWAVPPSATPVKLSQIRVTGTPTGSGGGTSSDQITINDVSGLSTDLSAIDSSLSSISNVTTGLNSLIVNLTNTVTNLGSTVSSLSAGNVVGKFIDDETPSGTINGTNTVFTLANTPVSASTLMLYRNGILQANAIDYSVSGNTIAFSAGEAPQTGDSLLAYYQTAGTGTASTIVDDEIPGGTINGTNLSFSLQNSPNPTISLKLFKNGALLQQNVDYTISNQTITFASTAVTPTTGDSLAAYYRTTGLNPSISTNPDGVVPAQPGHSSPQQ